MGWQDHRPPIRSLNIDSSARGSSRQRRYQPELSRWATQPSPWLTQPLEVQRRVCGDLEDTRGSPVKRLVAADPHTRQRGAFTASAWWILRQPADGPLVATMPRCRSATASSRSRSSPQGLAPAPARSFRRRRLRRSCSEVGACPRAGLASVAIGDAVLPELPAARRPLRTALLLR